MTTVKKTFPILKVDPKILNFQNLRIMYFIIYIIIIMQMPYGLSVSMKQSVV